MDCFFATQIKKIPIVGIKKVGYGEPCVTVSKGVTRTKTFLGKRLPDEKNIDFICMFLDKIVLGASHTNLL